MKFILTIDTEADNQWEHGCDITLENIKYIPRFQDLCNRYNIKPTYLVTSEVCSDGFAKELFREYINQHSAEVGAHLHSWTTSPFMDQLGFRYNDNYHAFATELPLELLTAKIGTLTAQIENSFGIRPLSFRSGRYGFNNTIAKVLADFNYLVDSSITPFTSWGSHQGIPGSKGGPDFLEKTSKPFVYSFTSRTLLEIPVTIMPTVFPLNKSERLAKSYFRNVNSSAPLKVMRKLFFQNQPLWFRPFEWVKIEMLHSLLNEAKKAGLPFIVMMFHSSELMPGSSKNFPDKTSIDRLFLLLENLFLLLSENNIDSVTLSEAAKESIL